MPDDVVPVSKQSKEDLVNVINMISGEVVIAAKFNVARDLHSKKIRILTSKEGGKRSSFNINGYDVQITYNTYIANSRNGVGSYRFQHNAQIMTFAAAKFASGEKELGLSLLKLLAEAEPRLFWDSPNPVMPIDQIVKGLSKDDSSLKIFLSEMSNAWQETVKEYSS